jgi:hypothetical protein
MHFHRDVMAIADTFSRHVLRPEPDDVFAATPDWPSHSVSPGWWSSRSTPARPPSSSSGRPLTN